MNGSVNNISPANLGVSDVYITEAAMNMQANLNKTDGIVQTIKSAQRTEDPEAVMEACREFESYFLQIMFREMRKTTLGPKEGMFAKSSAEHIFQDMMDEQVSILASKNSGLGLAAFMFKQMQREGSFVQATEENTEG